MNKYTRCAELETSVGFDRAEVEEAIEAHVLKTLHHGHTFFASCVPGVIAMELPHYGAHDKLDWAAAAPALALAAGCTLEFIDSTEWSFDDEPDEEALIFVFRTAHTPANYLDNGVNAFLPDGPVEVVDGKVVPKMFKVVLTTRSVTTYEACLTLPAASRAEAMAQAQAIDSAGKAPWDCTGTSDEDTEVSEVAVADPAEIAANNLSMSQLAAAARETIEAGDLHD